MFSPLLKVLEALEKDFKQILTIEMNPAKTAGRVLGERMTGDLTHLKGQGGLPGGSDS